MNYVIKHRDVDGKIKRTTVPEFMGLIDFVEDKLFEDGNVIVLASLNNTEVIATELLDSAQSFLYYSNGNEFVIAEYKSYKEAYAEMLKHKIGEESYLSKL